MRQVLNLFLLSLFFLCSLTYALPTDKEKKMNIVSDSWLFNYKSGIDVYEGDVRIDQGTTHLSGDKLTTKKNPQHKIMEAVCSGIKKLAEYTTIPKEGDLPFHAKADVITFYPLKSLILLEGHVVVTQGDNSFNGPTIIYNIQDQTVQAPASTKGRTTIVLQPITAT